MHAETVIALISTGLAAIIAVVVPWVAFRLALRQDRARWLREQRAQLYVDMLTTRWPPMRTGSGSGTRQSREMRL
jgi:hypothetical protein